MSPEQEAPKATKATKKAAPAKKATKKATATKAAKAQQARRAVRRRTNYRQAADRSAPTPKPDRSVKAPRLNPIRITLDLEPTQHAELNKWCLLTALDMGMTKLPLVRVFRTLGELLVEDSDLGDKVRARLEETADD